MTAVTAKSAQEAATEEASWDAFQRSFGPTQAVDDIPPGTDPRCVWTCLDAEGRKVNIVAGFWRINRLEHYIAAKPRACDDVHIYPVYS